MATDPDAPHGRDENGKPLAPYGLKTDGTPRLSRRGAQAGAKGNTPRPATASSRPTARVTSLTDVQRKGMLCDLADSFFVAPLASASQAPPVVAKIGPKKADGMAGAAFIISQYAPMAADALIVLSKSKPGALAWLDRAEENAPWLMLAQVGVQATKALAQNFANPNPQFAAAGRAYAHAHLTAVADAINQQAAAQRAQGAATQPTAEYPEYAAA